MPVPSMGLARGSAKITVFRSRAVSRKESGPEPMADRRLRVDSGRSQTARIEVPTDGSRPEEIYSLNSGGVDFCRFFFLIKRIRVRVFGSTRLTSRVAEPAHDPRRQRSDRGDEPRARRAFARTGRAERALGRDTIGDVASRRGRTPVARMMGSAARTRR